MDELEVVVYRAGVEVARMVVPSESAPLAVHEEAASPEPEAVDTPTEEVVSEVVAEEPAVEVEAQPVEEAAAVEEEPAPAEAQSPDETPLEVEEEKV